MEAIRDNYVRRCKIVRVLDGDSLIVDCDLGYNDHHRVRVRLEQVYAPEIKSKEPIEKEHGRNAKDWVEAWIRRHAVADEEWDFIFASLYRDTIEDLQVKTFDRYVGVLFSAEGVNLNLAIMDQLRKNRIEGGIGAPKTSEPFETP